MVLSDISINRPVFAAMMIVALMVLGVVSITYINLEQTPDISPPFVTVTTLYPGASPEEVETTVTKPLEEAVSAVNGIKNISSITTEGMSRIVLEFEFEIPIKLASIEVREKVFQKKAQLPEEVKEPVIERLDPASRPVMWLGVSAPRPSSEIRDSVENVIKPAIEQIENVASIELVGGLEREVQVNLRQDRLKAYGIPIQQVVSTLKSENVNVPAGSIDNESREIVVRTQGEFTNIDQIGNIIVTENNNVPVYMRDIAEVVDGFKDLRGIARINGVDAVSMAIKKQSGSNTVALCDNIVSKISDIKKLLPEDYNVFVIRDDSILVKQDVANVRESIIVGVIMAVFIVFLFMHDWRSTVICALSLPTSLITTFFFMYIMGFSINIMTLMALSLIVGVLIDDAIVVRENIFRHMEEGMSPKEAASFGTAEIGLAVMATTFSIVAVFFPIAFMTGMIGKWFKCFGLTAAFAVMVSLFVSFTLDPMLSAYFMRPLSKEEKEKDTFFSRLSNKLESFYSVLDNEYREILKWTLGNKKTVILGAMGIFIGSLVLLPFIGVEFMSSEDRGEISVTIKMPPGTSLERTNSIATAAEKLIKKNPDVITIFTAIGQLNDVTNAHLDVYCTKKGNRKTGLTQEAIKEQIRVALSDFPADKIMVSSRTMDEGQEAPVTLYVRGEDFNVLSDVSQKLLPIVRSVNGTVDVSSSFEKGRPELEVSIDRDMASDMSLGTGMVANNLRSMIEGIVPSKYREGDREYDIRVRLAKLDRDSTADIENISFRQQFKGGRDIALAEIASIDQKEGPTEIRRKNRQREVLIQSWLRDIPLSAVINDIKGKVTDIKLPPGYQMGFGGQAERMGEAFSTLGQAFILGILFIYMVLASQFNSFIHPFTIMLSLPLAIVGAVITLFLFGMHFSMSTMFAIIMLLGLVTKNAILLVDYTNTLRSRGLTKEDAILQAGPARLRPILMTTLAMILGMLPVALSNAPGSEFRAPMALSIIGGLLTSMMLTLVVVPAVYSVLDTVTERFFSRKKTLS